MNKFELGQVVATNGIHQQMYNPRNEKFINFVDGCLFNRYVNGDWGDMCEEDKAMNDSAIINGDRILASYNIPEELGLYDEKIWIITEWDRSVTTILFPDEY